MYIVNWAKHTLCGRDSDDYIISNLAIQFCRQRRKGAHSTALSDENILFYIIESVQQS